MKILYISGMYPTPAYPQKGIFCHEQVKALKNLGIEVTVVVPVVFYDREIKVKEWEHEGINIHYVRFFKFPGARGFHNIGKHFYRRLKKSVKLETFDVYHADAPLPAGYAAMLASKEYKKPFIVHGHGLDVFLEEDYSTARNRDKISTVSQLVYEKADAVVGVSKKVLDNIQTRVDINKKAFVAYNGVDTESFTPVEKKKTDNLTVISIGNLIPLKGHRYLLQAIKALKDKGVANIKCQIVGRGYLDEELKAQARELGIEKQVEFKGYVPYAEVATLLKNADIFALPSYYEALGCVYLEAMACGIPAIGCYENGIDEIIEHGKTGFLVQPKNVNDIVENLIQLQNPLLREEIGRNARLSMVAQYKWSDSAKRLIEVYNFAIKHWD